MFPGLREARICVHRGLPLTDYLAQHLGLGAAGAAPEESAAGRSQPGAVWDATHRVASPPSPSGVANHLVHAVGAAMAATKLKTHGCAIAICGQVGLDSSDFHVAANFAGVFKAPVLFVVRAESEDAGAAASLAERATAYGLEQAITASEDALTVRDAVRAELAKVRAGRPGLLVLEAPRSSAGGTPHWLQQLGDAQLVALARNADSALERAFASARDGVRPALASLTRGVFAEESRALVDQRRDLSGEPSISPDEV
jgi:TPP-dependent pyruvate/acetoin dehydrogenase alpha subunit